MGTCEGAELDAPAHEDPVRARLEIMKHLEGDLEIRPLPAEAGQRVKGSSLPAGEKAAFLRLVAGAGFAECYTAAATYWIDLVRQ
jgi:hypothetical protein